jgi:putative ABC transport system permease protein
MNRLVISNLLYRPIRSLVSVTAIAVEIVLILVIVGLLLGMVNDSRQRQQGMGAEIMVQPPGTSFLMGLSGLPGASGLQVRSMREWLSLMTPANLPGFSRVVELVIAIAVIIGFIVIFQTMYTAVLERTREIGILKSLGSSKLYIINLVLRETLFLAMAGAATGIVASFFARVLINSRFPTLQVLIEPRWIGYALIVALAAAVMGGIYPAFQAAQKDPIDALAYE